MSQVFRPPLILWLKLSIAALFAVIVVAWVALYQVLPAHSGPLTPQQPLPFSHKHHAGDDGIDCRYCHYSVEKSAFAGIPSSEVCLTCHSQLYSDAAILAPLRESARTGRPLAWERVHDLPDFVYFNHSIHIAKGVGCVECHGRVDRMPRIVRVASLEMQWCLGCHRNPGPHLREPDKVFDLSSPPARDPSALMSRLRIQPVRNLTDCSTCHR